LFIQQVDYYSVQLAQVDLDQGMKLAEYESCQGGTNKSCYYKIV